LLKQKAKRFAGARACPLPWAIDGHRRKIRRRHQSASQPHADAREPTGWGAPRFAIQSFRDMLADIRHSRAPDHSNCGIKQTSYSDEKNCFCPNRNGRLVRG
jgi:hypothetical protein